MLTIKSTSLLMYALQLIGMSFDAAAANGIEGPYSASVDPTAPHA